MDGRDLRLETVIRTKAPTLTSHHSQAIIMPLLAHRPFYIVALTTLWERLFPEGCHSRLTANRKTRIYTLLQETVIPGVNADARDTGI